MICLRHLRAGRAFVVGALLATAMDGGSDENAGAFFGLARLSAKIVWAQQAAPLRHSWRPRAFVVVGGGGRDDQSLAIGF